MKAVILHGTLGEPGGNWFPWLKAELEARGRDVFIPRLPTPANQSRDQWCVALQDQVPALDSDTLLIGHSCGATFLLHILEGLDVCVAQAIFVAPVTSALGLPDYDALNRTFCDHTFDWDSIRRNVRRADVFCGDDDPYVPLEQPQGLAKSLNAPLTIIPGGRHLNAEAGYTEFPELLQSIECGDD